jgi:hypothetical protein
MADCDRRLVVGYGDAVVVQPAQVCLLVGVQRRCEWRHRDQRGADSSGDHLLSLGFARGDLARKHGAENVTVLATMVGGPATNTIGVLATSEDWATYGKSQQSLQSDPKFQEAMLAAGQIGTWETYVSQTTPDM